MPPDSSAPTVKQLAAEVVSAIDLISPAEWDACAKGADPFVSHAFLSALEHARSASAETGWLPQHLAIRDDRGELIGAAPLYLKAHSFGEYVFDWGWAHAYERAGGDYYPKLQCCVPFTPVTGPRLLVRPTAPTELVSQALVGAMQQLVELRRASSLHITFATKAEWDRCGRLGLLQRRGLQYHWENDGYESFDDFLSRLVARKRKMIRKERRRAHATGLRIRVLTGAALTARYWDDFYRLYLSTIDKKQFGQAYLTRELFHRLGETMGDKLVLMAAEQDGALVAAALNLRGEQALFGRYWGSLVEHRFLHFELCYYQAIELAIRERLQRVEAGAQGPHKIQRGYLPTETYSAHWIRDPRLAAAVEHFLAEEQLALRLEKAQLEQCSPYRQARPDRR